MASHDCQGERRVSELKLIARTPEACCRRRPEQRHREHERQERSRDLESLRLELERAHSPTETTRRRTKRLRLPVLSIGQKRPCDGRSTEDQALTNDKNTLVSRHLTRNRQ